MCIRWHTLSPIAACPIHNCVRWDRTTANMNSRTRVHLYARPFPCHAWLHIAVKNASGSMAWQRTGAAKLRATKIHSKIEGNARSGQSKHKKETKKKRKKNPTTALDDYMHTHARAYAHAHAHAHQTHTRTKPKFHKKSKGKKAEWNEFQTIIL